MTAPSPHLNPTTSSSPPPPRPAQQTNAQHANLKETIRVLCFFRKRPDLTDAEFYHHWEHVHGPLLAPWIVKHGIESYTQIHTTPPLQSQWSNLLVPPLPAPLPTIPHHGYALMDFDSPERMRAAFADPYYTTVVAQDEEKFLDKSGGEYGEGREAMSAMGRVVRVVEGGVSVVRVQEV